MNGGDLIPFPHRDRPAEASGGPPVSGDGADTPTADRDEPPGGEVEPSVFEAELVDEPAVDVVQPPSQTTDLEVAPWSRTAAEWLPLVPAWLATAESRRAAVRQAGRYVRHRTLFHGWRLVLVYPFRYGARVPVGAARVAGAVARFGWDAETAAVARQAASAGETGQYTTLQRVVSDRRTARAKLLLLGAVLLVAGYVALRWWAPPHVGTLVLLAVLVLLSYAGRRPDKPVVSSAVASRGFERLTQPMVHRALAAAGLGGKAPKQPKPGQPAAAVPVDEDTSVGTPQILNPGVVRDGKGWAVTVDLPYGKTFADATNRRAQLASGLDVAAVQLFLEADPDKERRVRMWVADTDPYAGKPNLSPLARCPQVSVWQAQRLGVEPRGRALTVPLIFNGFLVGANPRQGKTYCARCLIAPAILDPYCDVSVLGAKSSDWEDLEQVAVLYNAGEGDDDSVAYSVAALQQVKAECQRRYDAIRALPRDQRPEGKITPELAAHGFAPHVVVLEEAQNVFGHRDASGTKRSALAKESLYLASFIAKVGPAAGITLVICTQRPSTEVIPSDLRDILSVRIALKTSDRTSSDTILGDYKSAQGIESASLINMKHAGVAVVVGVDNGRGGDHQTIRGDLLTSDAFARICAIGRQRRIDAGTLRGHAAGDVDPVQVTVSLPHDVVAVWPAGEQKATGEELAQRLAGHRPELYAGWGADTLTRALQVPEEGRCQVKRGGVNQRGYLLSAVVKLAAQTGSSGVAGSTPDDQR